MLKVKVLIPFRDIHTGKIYKKGDTINVTTKRFVEIIRKGDFVEIVTEEKA